ncbi:MAG: amino acid ABC transporter permease [Elusimicrobia bacterium]|nr:amino acid ABC transporter permease [Elusimicrobiota bacterium]
MINFFVREFAIYWKILKFLLPVVPITLKITILSFLIAVILGIIIALVRTSHSPLLRKTAMAYIDMIRGIPLLVQIFFIYFGLGKLFNLSQFPAGIIAISICYSAYLGEIFRSGIEAIPKGQYDACKSLGMNAIQTMRYVVLPQAFRVVIPPVANEFIACLKDSSLVSIIGLRELTRAGREFYTQYFVDFETWFMVGMVYLAMVVILTKVVSLIEKKYKIVK